MGGTHRLFPSGFGCPALCLSSPRAGLTPGQHPTPPQREADLKALSFSPDSTDDSCVYIGAEDENQDEGSRTHDKKCFKCEDFQPGNSFANAVEEPCVYNPQGRLPCSWEKLVSALFSPEAGFSHTLGTGS